MAARDWGRGKESGSDGTPDNRMGSAVRGGACVPGVRGAVVVAPDGRDAGVAVVPLADGGGDAGVLGELARRVHPQCRERDLERGVAGHPLPDRAGPVGVPGGDQHVGEGGVAHLWVGQRAVAGQAHDVLRRTEAVEGAQEAALHVLQRAAEDAVSVGRSCATER